METRMLAYEEAASVTTIASWANDLVGRNVPGSPDYRVVRVLRFQIVNRGSGYDAVVLVEVTEEPDESQEAQEVSLKEEDIMVIEQITSAIGDVPDGDMPLPEV